MPITGDAKGYKASLEEVAGECVDTHYRTLKEYYCLQAGRLKSAK